MMNSMSSSWEPIQSIGKLTSTRQVRATQSRYGVCLGALKISLPHFEHRLEIDICIPSTGVPNESSGAWTDTSSGHSRQVRRCNIQV